MRELREALSCCAIDADAHRRGIARLFPRLGAAPRGVARLHAARDCQCAHTRLSYVLGYCVVFPTVQLPRALAPASAWYSPAPMSWNQAAPAGSSLAAAAAEGAPSLANLPPELAEALASYAASGQEPPPELGQLLDAIKGVERKEEPSQEILPTPYYTVKVRGAKVPCKRSEACCERRHGTLAALPCELRGAG